MKTFYAIICLSVIAIILSFSLGAFNAYFYPVRYKDEIVSFGAEYGVDAGLVASVANVESGFDESAKSMKGAIGIMQLMPATAEWIAGKIGQDYEEDLLYSGEYNLRLGSFYLSYLLLQFGDVKTALCAYNAGQGNVKKWLKNQQYSNDGISLNRVPFVETKNYLNKVLKNYNYYKNKYK